MYKVGNSNGGKRILPLHYRDLLFYPYFLLT